MYCGILADAAFADTCCLAASITKVVETGAPYTSSCDQLYFLNSRVVQGKRFLDADTVRNLAYRIGCIHGTALSLDNNALENLNPFLAALNDADMDTYRISRPEFGVVHSHLLLINFINDCAHVILFC